MTPLFKSRYIMNIRSWSTIAALFLFISISTAQPIRVSTLEQMLEVAGECEAAGDYVNALEWYENAYKEEKNYSLVPKIAELHAKTRNYKRAVSWYERLFKREREENQFLKFRLPYAQVLKANGDYQLALDNYKIVLENNPSDADKALAVLDVQGINQYNALSDNIEVDINPAEALNNGSAESRPIEYDDGSVYFSSFNRRKAIDLSDVEEDFHMKIYTSMPSGDGEFSKPVALPATINRKDYHTTNPAFSEDGREMYFTRIKMEETEVIFSKLYMSYRDGDEGWKPPIELEAPVNGDYMVKNPALGELFGERVLFFSSNMPGGMGGDDIYYSTIKGNGKYTTPVNLGEGINTAGDEVTPFYLGGKLYFSSNGLPTIGGFDMFSAKWNGESWSAPENMGLGYNSSLDDLYLSFSKEGNRGYFVSNRPSKNKKKITSETCCDDIFTIKVREVVIDLIATISDANGGLNGASVELKNLTNPNQNESKKEETSNQFSFLLDGDNEYRVVVSKEGYYPDSLEFNTAGIIDDYTVNKSITLKAEPVVVVEPPKQDPGIQVITINEPIRLNSIYYDLDDDKILKDAEEDLLFLKELMNTYPTMVIELSSHTDSRGRDTYNMDLSQRRSESAKKWLTKKGVAKDRIVAKGYGETQILNGCSNGVKCSEDEHRRNRRTEFKIISGPTSIEIKREVRSSGQQSMFVEPRVSKYFVQDTVEKYPDFKFVDDNFNLGEMTVGEAKSMLYTFTNSGESDLIIELVTACKCTMIEWTREPIAPGGQGEIFVKYDSGNDKAGTINKVVDVIANTKQVVNELRFEAKLLPKLED